LPFCLPFGNHSWLGLPAKIFSAMKLDSPLNQFRLIALMEGVSFLLFAITMPLKYGFGIPEPNFFVGLAHGLLFMLYIAFGLRCWVYYAWKFGTAFLVFLASLLPFGTFILDQKFLKNQPA